MERAAASFQVLWLGFLILIWLAATRPGYAQAPQVEISITAPSDSAGTPPSRRTYRSRTLLLTFQTHHARQTPRYFYRLEGNGSRPWMDCGAGSQVVLAELAGGTHTLAVRDSINYTESRLTFEIETTIFETWWFWLAAFLYGLGVIGVLFYLLFLYRYQQKLRLLRMRERVARDLHDDMGSQLSSISIMSQNMEQMARQNPAVAQRAMAQIGVTARQVMDTMSDIVWSVNPDNDSLARIVERMKDCAAELFDLSDTQIVFEADEQVLKASLSLEKRRDFFLIFKEALTNAARYARASVITIRLDRPPGLIRLSVRDDGVGFDPACPPHSKGGNGLRNMQSRAASIGASLEFCSNPGQGTAIILALPVP